MKYEKFQDWFEEMEIFSTRSDRFHDEFLVLDIRKRMRAVEWMQAAWECARMQGEENGNQENDQKEN